MSTEPFDFQAIPIAFWAFVDAATPTEARSVLQQSPDLLSDAVVKQFELMINDARVRGDEKIAQSFEQRRALLQTFKQPQAKKDSLTIFQADINQANAAQARYQQGEGVQALDEAVAAWERILNHPEFTTANEKLRLGLLNDSACTYLRRYWATGVLKDLYRALSCWEEAVASENSPDLPMYLNNLGTGLRARYARTGKINGLQKGIEAFQQAVRLTPENSPHLPVRLNNLGTGLRDRYARTGKINDLQKGIEAFQKAVKLTPENSPDLPGYLNNLGLCLRYPYKRTGEINDLQQGIEAFQKAVAASHGVG